MKTYLVITFASTFDAMEAEEKCREAKVPGRIIPLPPDIRADCGLAWRMPPEEEEKFDRAVSRSAGRYVREFRY